MVVGSKIEKELANFACMTQRVKIGFIALFLILFNGVSAQTISNGDDSSKAKSSYNIRDKVFFGGNLGAQFGTNTMINVSPLVGYKLTDKISIGTQFIYNYVNLQYSNYRYKDNIFGYSAFGRVFVFKDFFATTAYEVISGRFDGSGKRINVPSWFVGGGYYFRMSDRSGLSVAGLYNLTPSLYTPYSNPTLNIGFVYGL